VSNESNIADFSSNKKYAFIFCIALTVSILLALVDERGYADVSFLVASALGISISLFALASIFTFRIKGKRGAYIGGALVICFAFLSWYGNKGSSSSPNAWLRNLEKNVSEMREAGQRDLNQTGQVNVDYNGFRKIISQLEEDKKSLAVEDKRAIEALTSLLSQVLESSEAAEILNNEILTPDFIDLSKFDSQETITKKVTKLVEVKAAYSEVLNQYRSVDISLKHALKEKDVAPLTAKEISDSFVKSIRLDLTLPLAKVNVRYIETLIDQLSLLRDEFENWDVSDGTVIFANDIALNKWNSLVREQYSIFEEQERLQRQIFFNK
jgi:hypothetical protein